jgi:hypothetical protein
MKTIELTKLENDVMERMIAPFVGQEAGTVVGFLERLRAIDRSLSADALDGSKCCGFYVHFEDVPLPNNTTNSPPRLSVQAQREGLPFGADFILFLTPGHHLKFLEGTFYGCSIPTIELMKNDHGFRFS